MHVRRGLREQRINNLPKNQSRLPYPRRCCGSSSELTMDYICYETTEACKFWQTERSSGQYISNDEDGYPTCEGCCGDDAGARVAVQCR